MNLEMLKRVVAADVYKNGTLAGTMGRMDSGVVRFAYTSDYLAAGHPQVAFSLPLSSDPVETTNGAIPAFFAGLLPEGHRLTVLKNAAKTSFDDELTLLLAVGADVPGDVQIVPAGEAPVEPDALADASHPGDLDFAALANSVDLHGLPGVQDKASASMLTTPLATRGQRFLLKLDPAENPHLVVNEATHLTGARGLGIPVASAEVVLDRTGREGLLVKRFDRAKGPTGQWGRLPLEDGTQVMNLPPAVKYGVSAEAVALALAEKCRMPLPALRNFYLQFLFAWLSGNGDLHAKNISILGDETGFFAPAPVYDVPCTLLYGDETMALPIAGKQKNLRARHWTEFANTLGLPPRTVAAANNLALKAATSIDLSLLPFEGSPLNGTQRELRFRRHELEA